jgi:pimeloyl-ACP methyl ester carboxylesterase
MERITVLRSTVAIISGFLLLGLAFTAYADQRDVLATYAKPGQLVTIHGRHINLYCMGEGSPTVVLESGLANSAFSWWRVQPEIGKISRVCSYDRAGLGFSDPARSPRDLVHETQDLHDMLLAAGLRPPYVLVGHSRGGDIVLMFADEFRPMVAGLVLVDPGVDERPLASASPSGEAKIAASVDLTLGCLQAIIDGQWQPGSAVYEKCGGAPKPDPNLTAELNGVVAKWELDPSHVAEAASEWRSLGNDYERLEAAERPLGGLPMIVLSAGGNLVAGQLGLTSEEARALQAERNRIQTAYANQSSEGVRTDVPGSGHFIQIDNPTAVIDAVSEVVRKAHDQPPAARPSEASPGQ